MLFVISTNDLATSKVWTKTLSWELLETETDANINAEQELDNLVKRVDDVQEEKVSSDEVLIQWEKLELQEGEKQGFFSRIFNRKSKAVTGTGAEIWQAEVTDEIQVEQETQEITKQDEVNPQSTEAVEENTEETASWDILDEWEEKASLFDKLFGEKEIPEETEEEKQEQQEKSDNADANENKETAKSSEEEAAKNNDSNNTENKNTTETEKQEVTKVENTQTKTEEKETAKNDNTQTTVTASPISVVGGNISKNSGTSHALANASLAYMHQYSKEIQDSESKLVYPGLDLKTKIGKEFEVGVHMLKLNNANFDVKLALMNHGDRLKQLTKETQYGCFMIEVVDAKNRANIGKKGFVCKKYLQEASATKQSNTQKNKVVKKITPAPTPKIEAQEQIVPASQESFLPTETEIVEKRIVPTESFLPEEPIIIPSSEESFLPAEAEVVEKRIVPTESFLPEENSN